MKTIEEASLENSKLHYIMAFGAALHFDADMDFTAGVNFAQRWIPISEELPEALERGEWNGRRSEFILAKDRWDDWHKARCYTGYAEGVEDCLWTDINNDVLLCIVSWRPIELK